MTEYRFETFEPSVEAEAPDARTSAYLQAVSAGFHGKRDEGEKLRRRAERAIADGRIFTAAYADNAPHLALDPSIPVATFAHFEKTVNVGGGRLVPAHLITWVTVRPTHRRRGLLRSLMTANLVGAHEAGYPFAALTATEGSIYRRFGFGPATWYNEIELDTSPGFQLAVEPDRRLEMVDPHVLRELGPALYDRFQMLSPGATGRQRTYVDVAAGDLDRDTGDRDRGTRAAVHYDEDGVPDGYVSYRFAGWDVKPTTIDVMDFVAVSDAAYSSLWAFLGAVDLVERVRFDYAAQESPLPWLLADPRRARTTAQNDGMWLRILDPVSALEARPYTVPGSLTLAVTDDMGFASGVFRLVSAGVGADGSGSGDGRVEKLTDDTRGADAAAADLALDVSELGSLYLGGADPVVLARAGRITQLTPGAAVRARALFGLERAPYAPNDF
ncbi:GNAT family N-acetyltransferase [Brevibacterium album]|uniref:GNAT family N-acetyltransferase n=1 Tax=Brevibacterium album TaxID=417948 RepID=UPI0004223DBA|nr:GNAT family N-acetyltransferase [Brevibacterium album]